MTILLYDLVGYDNNRPFSPHCWKTAMALAHKGLDFSRVPTRFLELPTVEGGISKQLPVIRDGKSVIADSFTIAIYLEGTYPNQPTLFRGEGGKATARFIERWAEATLYPYINTVTAMDLLWMQTKSDAAYFRETRERDRGRSLEEVVMAREAGLESFRASLEPLRSMLAYQPFLGGQTPLYADYIVFGAFQLSRVASPFCLLEDDDEVALWFQRCLDLHSGLGREVSAAA